MLHLLTRPGPLWPWSLARFRISIHRCPSAHWCHIHAGDLLSWLTGSFAGGMCLLEGEAGKILSSALGHLEPPRNLQAKHGNWGSWMASALWFSILSADNMYLFAKLWPQAAVLVGEALLRPFLGDSCHPLLTSLLSISLPCFMGRGVSFQKGIIQGEKSKSRELTLCLLQ